MSKNNLILRSVCFIAVYLLVYALPLFVIETMPLHLMKHLPSWMGNLCFFLPQYAFPFDEITLGEDDSGRPFIFGEHIALLISALYLILLGLLFSKLTQPVRKSRWIIPLAFCSSALSITLLNVVFMACGIMVHLSGP
jgi:hypothetical protein